MKRIYISGPFAAAQAAQKSTAHATPIQMQFAAAQAAQKKKIMRIDGIDEFAAAQAAQKSSCFLLWRSY